MRNAEDESLGFGATQREVSVGERIDNRIAFHVLVADRSVPVPTRLDLGMTDQKIGVPTGVATIKARAIGAQVVDGTTGYQVAVEPEILDEITIDADADGVENAEVD